MGRREAARTPGPVNDRAAAQEKRFPGSSPAAGPDSSLLGLQRRIGNSGVVRLLQNATPGPAVQRIFDDFNEKVPTDSLSVSKHFRDRHVATDAADAVEATLWRIDHDSVPNPMRRGRMANTVATENTWISALDASPDHIEVGTSKGGKGKGGPQVQKGEWQGKSGSGQQKGPTVRFKPATVWQVTYNPVTDDASAVETPGPDLIAGGLPAALTKNTKSGKQDLGQSFVLDHISNP